MFADALSKASPFLWSAASGAIDGGALGGGIGLLAALALVKISKMKTQNAGYNGNQVLMFASVTVIGGIIGGAGGSAYQVGRDVLLLDTINNVGFTLVTVSAGAGLLAYRFSEYF